MRQGRQFHQNESTTPSKKEKRRKPIRSRAARPTQANGKAGSVMAMACKSGRMVRNTSGTGMKTRRTAKANLCTWTATCIKALGLMTRRTGSAFTSIRMVQCMTESGGMISSTVEASRSGSITPGTKATTIRAGNMVSAPIGGVMEVFTPVSGEKTKSRGSVFTSGSMVAAMKANGTKTTWRVWGATHGLTAVCTRAFTETIRNMALVFTNGLTVVTTKDSGIKVSSMGSAFTLYQRKMIIASSSVCGKMANVSSGLTKSRCTR